jgi:hypothetical protein
MRAKIPINGISIIFFGEWMGAISAEATSKMSPRFFSGDRLSVAPGVQFMKSLLMIDIFS